MDAEPDGTSAASAAGAGRLALSSGDRHGSKQVAAEDPRPDSTSAVGASSAGWLGSTWEGDPEEAEAALYSSFPHEIMLYNPDIQP